MFSHLVLGILPLLALFLQPAPALPFDDARSEQCPDEEGYVFLLNSCYFFEKESRVPWEYAQAICGSLGGRLVEMDTMTERDLLTGYLIGEDDGCVSWGYYSVWIGGIERGSSNSFSWASSPGEIIDPNIANWEDGRPDNPGQGDAIALDCNDNYKWVDRYNTTQHPFICEIPPLGSTSSTSTESTTPWTGDTTPWTGDTTPWTGDTTPWTGDTTPWTSTTGDSTTPETTTPGSVDCPPDFDPVGSSCYLLQHSERLNWNDAQAACASKASNGKLMELESQDELDRVLQYLTADSTDCSMWGGYPIWIGGREQRNTNSFSWFKSGLPVDVDYWYTDRPNLAGEYDAMVMGCVSEYRWFDTTNTQRRPYACEADPSELND